MARGRLIKSEETRNRIIHLIAVFVIFTHTYEKYEGEHGSYLFFGLAGLTFLTVVLLHSRLAQKYPWVDGTFFAIEGLLSLAMAYDYFHMGKKALPACYVLLAFFQFFMAFRKGKKGAVHHKVSH